MLDVGTKAFLKDTERIINKGRSCAPGNFYLIHRIGVLSEDPITEEKTYHEEREYCQPVVRVFKGDEHIVLGLAGIVAAGDISCSFLDRPGLVLNDVKEVIYKDDTYYVTSLPPWKKGLGKLHDRQVLFCSREPGT